MMKQKHIHSVLRLLSILILLILTSCINDLQSLSFNHQNAEDVPEGFYNNLANEYDNLADYEAHYMKHDDDATYFKDKAQKARRGQMVNFDHPDQRLIPVPALPELRTAYTMLTDALSYMKQNPDNGALLAMAQTRYDCWLVHQEDFPDAHFQSACKTGFYDSLALLNIPEEDQHTYSIYFDSGSIALNKEAKQTLENITACYQDRTEWSMILKGFTDPKGNKQQNKILSMRRAIAVKNMLGQYGFDLDNIAISAEGEALINNEDTEDSHNSRRVDIRVKPHYISEDKSTLHTLPGWQHSGEF